MFMLTLTAGVPVRDRLELGGLIALLGLVAALQLSIAVAQILLTVAALCWLASHLVHRERVEPPAYAWPLVAYAALTLLSAGFSGDPAISMEDCKQLVLFLLVPVVYDLARGGRARLVVTVALTIGAASAIIGIVQYGILNYDNLGRRMQGTLSHWMTYSGTLMLMITAAVARLLYDNRDRMWAAMIMPALLVSLALTLTRSAWVGAAAGIAVLLLRRDFRLLAILPVVFVTAIVVAPGQLTSRVYSILDVNDETNRDRLAMLEAGSRIIRDHPLTGVGPDMVERVYPDYRVAYAVKPTNPHLHNVPMQIAAERGLPALAAWLWFVIALTRDLWRMVVARRQMTLAAGGLGAVAAMLVAGMFEYNFGDSEFLMLFLVLVTLPFAADRTSGAPRYSAAGDREHYPSNAAALPSE
jgi:O-antigen ligase